MDENKSLNLDTDQQQPRHSLFAIRRPVSTAMLFLTLAVFGWRSYQNLPINLMPDISYPSLTVRTEYEGAAPEDVEMLVTRPLEELLSIVSNMVEISSVSSPGLSEIILEFTWDADMNLAQQEVRDRLDLFDPPREVTSKPVILRYDPGLDPIMRVAITSDNPEHIPGSAEERAALTTIREAAERKLKADLEAESGIAQAQVKGGQEEEIQVLLDIERLKALGISPHYVITTLAQQNINLSGGQLREGETEYLVRTLNEFRTIDDIANSIIVTPAGAQRRLFELANVFLGTKDRESIVHINGQEAVAIDIFKEGDANTVTICNKVRGLLGFEQEYSFQERMMEAYKKAKEKQHKEPDVSSGMGTEETEKKSGAFLDRLPPYAKLSMISDQSRFIRGAIKEVQTAILQGGVLALLVLFLFLQEMRSTVIIGISIPISVITAFVPMFFRGVTLNIMSLGGLALGVGMLVDNSIVVLESVFRCREEGDDPVTAADRGTREVFGAVIASTLTTICVFLPVIFVEGIAGQLFNDLAMTVTFSLSASLLAALYLIPLMVSRSTSGLQSSRYVVWIVAAFREGRDDRNYTRGQALLMSLPISLGYAVAFLKKSWIDFVAPLGRILLSSLTRPSWKSIFTFPYALLAMPVGITLFLARIVLGTLLTLLVTVLFLCLGVVFAIFSVTRKILNVILYVPLKVFAHSFEAFRRGYGVVLNFSLRLSPLFILAAVFIFIHSIYLARDLGRELMPPMRQGEFGLRMEIRAGAQLEETEQRARRFEEIIRSVPEVDSVTVEIGQEKDNTGSGRGENVAQFTVLLHDMKEQQTLQDEIIDDLRRKILAAATDETITFSTPTLFSFRSAIETQLAGDVQTELRRYGQIAITEISQIPGVKDAELSVKPGYPELIIEMDRNLLAARGLSPGDVAQRLRSEIQGEVATRFSRGADKIDIRVRADQNILRGVDDLQSLSVVDGLTPIPLRDVANLRIEQGPSEIRRIGQRRTVLISANVEGRDLGAVSADIDQKLASIALPQDMYFLQSGQRRELDTAFGSLGFVLLLAAFLVYVVMACQFESLIQPALVMFTAPLAFIGVIYVLYLTETSLSVMVFLGGVILIGIAVNNAIVLVDYTNQLRERGLSKHDAIVEAGKVRLRPILMTTITTVLGLLPMVISSGDGAEMRRPLALTLIAGLSVATLLTLFIIPMAYNLFTGKERS
ncbi:MAG: efflux RND transporter permease subunit [Candidatus Hydrogenedentales bacterium]|jgi:HAE1 family hydrophobic/amphiphilic exporter-1